MNKNMNTNTDELFNAFYDAYKELEILKQETANELATDVSNKNITDDDEIDKDLYDADDDYFDDDCYDVPIDECDDDQDDNVGPLVKDTINKINTINKIDTEGTPDKATHYKGAVEPLEVMSKLLTRDEFIGFLKGNMIKYSYRAGRKQGESGEKDRNKFLVYSEWLRKVNNLEPIVLGDKVIILQKHLQCRDNYHIETFTMYK